MVWQLTSRLCATLVLLSALATLALPSKVVAEPLVQSEKQYRLAAWYFYQEAYYDALLQLALAPENPAKASLLQAGLLLQLDMPAATAALLQRLLADQTLSGELPRQLRNIALLQFSRYQFEQQQAEQARFYYNQLTPPLNELRGEAELLNQLLNWPALHSADPKLFERLADQQELPYIVVNHIQALRQQQQPAQAQQLLHQLTAQLQFTSERGFWRQLFSWRSARLSAEQQQEQQALADYLQLLQAGILAEQEQWAAAQNVLSDFASNSVLTLPAMTLYRDVLTENRQIPELLAVLQQLIVRFPYAPASWLAAHQLGMQFERALQQHDALAAYRWADQYYQQQLAENSTYASAITAQQLVSPATLSGWQHYQLRQHAALYQLEQQLLAVRQLQQLHQQRLTRLDHLTEVTQSKLVQQQQLLSTTLPNLTLKQQQLKQQVAQLSSMITEAAASPMAQQLWLSDSEQDAARQQQMISRAEGRLQALQAAGRDISQVGTRLARVRGILQWHYQQNSAERYWQLTKLQQQLANELTGISEGLQRLTALDGKTTRLLAQQQQLQQLTARERQFTAALAVQQQHLLEQLNSKMQQLRLAEREQLQAMLRLNTQAIARVMEQVLVSAQGTQ